MTNIFDQRESVVRSYCRSFPTVFERASGPFLYDEAGNEYLDFFCGAGTLNYGHNNPRIKQAVIDYLQRDGVVHALDMWTVAKRAFLETLESVILKPRNLDYKVQFTGPTGANAVEAALKLARKVKGRRNVVAFTNGYHGLSAGALACTGNRHFRNEAFVNRLDVSFMPYDGYFNKEVNTLDYFKRFLADNSSGLDLPAAVILETIQAEGGINVASDGWLRGLEEVCREFDILLIVDDIQVGNGRTGTFFSFEPAGIKPDMVVLSKAIGGLGLPVSLLLLRPEVDQWKPAEHTGTFRGNNLAFIAATAALDYWRRPQFAHEITRKGELVLARLEEWRRIYPAQIKGIRGKGLIWGMEMATAAMAKGVSQRAFARKLILELAGADDQVVKLLPPLILDDVELERGFSILADCLAEVSHS